MGEMDCSALCRNYGCFPTIYNIKYTFHNLELFPTLLFKYLNYWAKLALAKFTRQKEFGVHSLRTTDQSSHRHWLRDFWRNNVFVRLP